MRASRTLLLVPVLLLLALSAIAQERNLAAGPPIYWQDLGRRAVSDPSAPTFRTDIERARFVMGAVERELIRQGIRPNTNVLDRAVSITTTGWLSTGSCGHISMIMQAAFKGAGFPPNRVYTIVGYVEAATKHNPVWTNTNHAAVGIVIGNQLVMFDPWEHAWRTDDWKGMSTSAWAGMSFTQWVSRIDDYETFHWETETEANLEKQSPADLEADVLGWSKRAAKTGRGNASAPAATAPSVAHWRRISGPTFTKERNADPVDGYLMAFTGSGGASQIKLEYHSGDGEFPMQDRMQNYATFVWGVTPGLEYLVPGKTLEVTGTLVHSEEWSAGARVFAQTPKGMLVGYLVRDVRVANGSTLVDGEWKIPAGGSHLPEMEIEFQCSNTGGVGRVRYRYQWSVPGAGTPQTPTQQPGGPQWIGNWKSQWGDMTFEVRGSTVKGTFTHKGGRFEGQLSPDGNSIMGKWTQEPTRQPPKDAGAFLFRIAPGGQSFNGSYWYGLDSSGPPAGPWSAKR